MKATIMDALANKSPLEDALKEGLEERNIEYSYFKVRNMKILPCRSCGSCGIRTPGRCVIKDDIHTIMKSVAPSNLLVYVTAIKFGGYSSNLKKVIDRFMSLGVAYYTVKNGHLLHPMRYGKKYLLGIGVDETGLPGQEENFRALVAANGLNMQSPHATLVFKPSQKTPDLKKELDAALYMVK